MKARISALTLLGIIAGALYLARAADPPSSAAASLSVARYGPAGELKRPPDLDRWVFLGASLGMNYTGGPFSPEHPGDIQVVLMEPGAYEYFQRHARYADGSMFLLSFYPAERGVSIDRAGFVPGARHALEIHVVDQQRYAEGHAFFLFDETARESTAVAPGSPCIKCHLPNGAFDGTFAQFYPPIRERLPKPQHP